MMDKTINTHQESIDKTNTSWGRIPMLLGLLLVIVGTIVSVLGIVDLSKEIDEAIGLPRGKLFSTIWLAYISIVCGSIVWAAGYIGSVITRNVGARGHSAPNT
jgi:uncharacterized membrane protein YidH (DUF202 family)